MRDKFRIRALVVLFAIAMVASCVAMYSSAPTNLKIGISQGGERGVISLTPPSFVGIASATEAMVDESAASQAGASFLEEEAGVSAYVNTSQSIDLDKAKSCYRNIEYECADYILGSVELPGLPEDEDVHVYVSVDGWIVAYYLRDEPASKIMQWDGYGGGEITTTKLEDAISKMCTCLEIPYTPIKSNIKYYDFKYPNANRLMIIVDRIDSPGTDTFEFKIPNAYTVCKASWSHFVYNSYGSNTKIKKSTDEEWITINSFGTCCDRWCVKHGYYDWIEPDEFYTVSIWHNEYSHSSWCSGYACIATTFIYREP
ncbi:MAG: hypothetical protein C4B59_07780 [Candidatus Methanogaster sp.]|uniref:Uncharacterized protein n=1 Tax=Candidatus Methanogaster sp. TaxID=3386292 RepID=A0AC61L256_9EURY|nr:MAG: hypothetical protein C4B59_07780 [ANME-2 cluster archaeon]